MAKITEEMAKNAYSIAMKIFDEKMKFTEGVKILKEEYKMNSATIYINNLSKLRTGDEYKRIISERDTKYFLTKIKHDYGVLGLQKALNAVKKHITYLENRKLGNRKAIKVVYDSFFEEE